MLNHVAKFAGLLKRVVHISTSLYIRCLHTAVHTATMFNGGLH